MILSLEEKVLWNDMLLLIKNMTVGYKALIVLEFELNHPLCVQDMHPIAY